jgi:hypothetical protein
MNHAKTLNKMTKDALVQEVIRLTAELDKTNATAITQTQAGVVRYRLAEVVDLDPATRTTVLKELDILFR